MLTRRALLAAALPPAQMNDAVKPLAEAVAAGQLRAAVLRVTQGDGVYERAFGAATPASPFLIASITKPMTAAAVMTVVEAGKLQLDAPAAKLLPGFDGRITLRQMLSHTSGLPDMLPENIALRRRNAPLREWAKLAMKTPLLFAPGEKVSYQSMGILLAATMAELVSGVAMPKLLEQRIYGPLGMKDTRFFVPAAEKDRLAVVYATGAEGKAVRAAEGSRGQGHYVDGPRKSFSGGAGLTSTARDYARFLEAIRRGGALDGARILGPRAVGLMTTNQSGTLHSTTGLGFGYGFQTIDRYGASGLAAVGAFGWSGAYGTTYQVDPKSRMVVVLMIQQMPNGTDIQAKYLASVYQALVD